MFPVSSRTFLTVLVGWTSTAVTVSRTFLAAFCGTTIVVTMSAFYAVFLSRTVTGLTVVMTLVTDSSMSVLLLIFVVALLSDSGTVLSAGLVTVSEMVVIFTVLTGSAFARLTVIHAL